MVLAEITGESAPRTHGSGLRTNGISGELGVGSSSCGVVLIARIGRDGPSIRASLDFIVSCVPSRHTCALPCHAVLCAPPELPCARFVDPLPQCVTSAGST